MKTKRIDRSTGPVTPKAWLWKSILLTAGVGLATWLLLAFLVPSRVPEHFPALPDLQQANPALRTLLQSADAQARSHPLAAADMGRLAMIYHANQFYTQAEKIYTITSELAPEDYRWPYGIALVKEEIGTEKEVPAWLQKTIQLNPRYYPALQKLADIHFKQERWDEAERYYRQSAEVGGIDSACQALSGLSRVAARHKDWNAVVSHLAPLSHQQPKIRTLHQWLQEAYTALGQTAKAEQEGRNLLDPTLIVIPILKDSFGEELLGYSCSATRLLKEAGLKVRFRRPDEAIRIARRAVEVEPTDADAHHFLSRTLLDAHGADPQAVEEALAHLAEGLRLRPEDLLPLWYFGTFFFQQEKADTAVEQLRTLLSAHADRAESHYYLGLVADSQGNTEEAMARYRQALRHDPQNAEACHKLGLIMVTAGKIQEAIGYFEQAVGLKPMFTLARCNLGIALAEQGKTSEAIAQFEEALQSKPNDAVTHQYLAIALLKSGKIERAVGHFREAVRLTPGEVEAHYGLGCALAMQKQTVEAREEFQEVLRLQPGHAEARKRLDELRP